MRGFTLLAIVFGSASAGPDHYGLGGSNLQCPPGFVLTGKNCERSIFGTPNIRCPVGALVGDQCIAHAPATTACPIGSVPDGNECAVVETIPATSNCPAGYAPNGNGCAQQIPLNLITTCDIGHDDGAGQCVQVEHAQKVVRTFCPPGYYDEGKGCTKVTEYDCSPPVQVGHVQEEAVVGIPIPLYGNQKKHGGHNGGYNGGYGGGYGGYRRMLGSRKNNVYAPPIIAAPPPSKAMIVPAPAIPAPPAPAVQVVRQGCQRKDFAPPVIESYCPEGFVEMGKSCQRITYYPPSQRCVNGAPANACFEVKSAPRTVACSKGVLNGEVCQWKQPVALTRACPAGTFAAGDDCQQITQPLATCPTGTYLDGRQCVGKEIAEPVGQITIPCTGKNCWNH